ncbi:tryptophan halogenase family protein [Qipengyuania sphaerica]|uniref:tryptophan halogenase family protein n=1 Tax=Qipengyuania sphaerica TaxID=2867243 RepID=UPI001C883805|nr:tryptophan halogenase family protein [Qipengyuania sphaerica]MBX7541221.1 tryptophan 7-halogenase [Qipengyuania sphaerica]
MPGSSSSRLKSIVIVGGGSAGWMTAAALSSLLKPKDVRITLVESEEIGTVGVGEATIPDIRNFNRILGIPEDEFMKATNATFKLGIEFRNWGKKGDTYFHPFGVHGADMQGIDFHQFWLHARQHGDRAPLQDYSICSVAAAAGKFSHPTGDPRSALSQLRYAYHFDATLYAKYLRAYAEKNGVIRIEGKVQDVQLQPESGGIQSIRLESGQEIEGDFFFDCTGFRSLLMAQKLGVGFRDWSHWLPCDSAQVAPCEHDGPPLPYTRSTAKIAGWQWCIPTQTRLGNGHVYCSKFISDDDARQSLMEDLPGKALAEPRKLGFTTGHLEEFWTKNCIAVGLSAGFLEPLESTSIYLIQIGISKFISLYPDASLSPIVRKEYNRQISLSFEQVRDFLILHYYLNERVGDPFWDYCRNMSLPDSLQYKLDLLKEAGRFFRYEEDLFSKDSWLAVGIGQNLYPATVDPIVAALPPEQVQHSLNSMRASIRSATEKMPTHQQYIQKYCPSAAG